MVSRETNIISVGLTMLWLLFSGMKCKRPYDTVTNE